MLPLTDYVLLDVETAARDDARKWVQADSRLVDKAKIAQSIEERAEKLALDPNGARIVCVGMWTHHAPEPSVMACPDTDREKLAIDFLWDVWRSLRRDAKFVGFRARTFDLRILIQRSRYLGLKTPYISTAPYGRGDVLDLFDELTFDNDRDASSSASTCATSTSARTWRRWWRLRTGQAWKRTTWLICTRRSCWPSVSGPFGCPSTSVRKGSRLLAI
jgi:hypothetical protein